MTLPVAVGIDASRVNDSTAVVIAQRQPWTPREPDDTRTHRVVLRSRVWSNPYPLRDSRHFTWQTPILEVEDYLREIYDRYPEPAGVDKNGRPIHGPVFLYDPMFFSRTEQVLSADRLNMVKVDNLASNWIPISKAFYEAIVGGYIAHNGDPVLTAHIRNVKREMSSAGWRMDKRDPRGIKKTDAAMAAAMAHWGATQFRPAPKVSVYAEKELLVL